MLLACLGRVGRYTGGISASLKRQYLRALRAADEVAMRQARNKRASSKTLTTLSAHPDAAVRALVGSNANTPADILRLLARDIDKLVRLAVANNVNTPVDCLVGFTDEFEMDIRLAVVANPSSDESVLKESIRDVSSIVRLAVIESPNVTEGILERVMHRESNSKLKKAAFKRLRELGLRIPMQDAQDLKLASLPKTSAKTLNKLSLSKEDEVREAVAGNPNTSSETLSFLSRDKYPNVRKAVAGNSNTPRPILEFLSRDKAKLVRQLATLNLASVSANVGDVGAGISKDVGALQKLVKKRSRKVDPFSGKSATTRYEGFIMPGLERFVG